MTASIWNPGVIVTAQATAQGAIKETQTLTGGQTVIVLSTIIYVVGTGAIYVYINGVLQILGSDYTETTTTSITLTSPASASDIVTVMGVINVNSSGGTVTQIYTPETVLPSSTTIDLGATTSNSVQITGTNSISSFGTTYSDVRYVRFASGLTLNYSSSLILPGATNISVSAGDRCVVAPKATGGINDGWIVLSLQRNASLADYSNTVRVDVASASTPNILYAALSSRNLRITGTTTINSFVADTGSLYFVTFAASTTLVNSANLVTNTGANITTQAGDSCIMRSSAYGFMEILSYVPVAIASLSQGGQLAGLRNRIINGDMRVAQRPAVLPSASYQYGQVDRHMVAIVGGSGFAGSITQWTGLSGVASGYACGVNASWTAGNFNLQHRIEAANCIDLNSKTITISCKVYQNTGGARNFKISVVKANSLDNHSAQTSLFTSGNFSVPSGATTPLSYTVTLGASDASNGIAIYVLDADAANTVVSKLYLVGELQIEVGSVATTFEQRPIGLELSLCQRYYEKSFPQATVPALNAGVGGAFQFVQIVAAASSQQAAPVQYVVTKRSIPNVNFFNPLAANSLARNNSVAADCSTTTIQLSSERGFGVNSTQAAGSNVGNTNILHYTADAEL